jgi:hypothetical protein
MKATLAIFITVLSFCPVLRADLVVNEVTPENAQKLDWKIEAFEKENHVYFTVQLPAGVLSQNRTAHLAVRQNSELMASCLLGLHKVEGSERYEFVVSKECLQESVFELGSKELTLNGDTYRIYLRKFVKADNEKENPAGR